LIKKKYIYIYIDLLTMSALKKKASYSRQDRHVPDIPIKEASISECLQEYKDIIQQQSNNAILSQIEFEIRMKANTKQQFNDIFKYAKKGGFKMNGSDYQLKILPTNHELRVEINNLANIQEYCNTNQLPLETSFVKKEFLSQHGGLFTNKDFLFNIAIQKESEFSNTNPVVESLINTVNQREKLYRYLHRTSLTCDRYPNIRIDMSEVQVVKTKDRFSKHKKMKTYYEVELELIHMNQYANKYFDFDSIVTQLKNVVKMMMRSFQNTSFPLPFHVLSKVKNDYLTLCNQQYARQELRNQYPVFIGPSSLTLQKENLSKPKDNGVHVSVLKDFCVTDKADGERKLLYINGSGQLYFVDSNLHFQYTGVNIKKSSGLSLNHTIIDGEYLTMDKNGNKINLFAAFDIYICSNKEYRFAPFVIDDEEKAKLSRYEKLKEVIRLMNQRDSLDYKSDKNRLVFTAKHFECTNESKTIFASCANVFDTASKQPYNIDGLIFTSKVLGVYQDNVGEKFLPRGKFTWKHSFKWKPPEFNTIDFLMRIKRNAKGEKVIHKKRDDQMNISEYYEVHLYVGYDPKKHDTLYSQKKILDLRFGKQGKKGGDDKDEYMPVLFSPSNPSDETAHICHIPLVIDGLQNANMYTEENERIEDDTIVEFKYVKNDKDKFLNWIPLRLREGKTIEYKTTKKNFGNSFNVANSNWKTIHDPIDEETLVKGITDEEEFGLVSNDDVYYDPNSKKKSKTIAMRDFHNKYVKLLLIRLATNAVKKQDPEPLLLDLAVGKGGDLQKWISCGLHGVLGIDIAYDNIHNATDGACARFIKEYNKRDSKTMPICMFIVGNTGKLIENGDFADSHEKDKPDKSSYIFNTLMGESNVPTHKIPEKFLKMHYGMFIHKFNICSIQFAMHYMFENKEMLHYFLTNVASYTRKNGYFIGTCFNGKRIYELLQDKDTFQLYNAKSPICRIRKQYTDTNDLFLKDNELSLGYKISVLQESIGKEADEYLVNFDFFVEIMKGYGFELVKEELKLEDKTTLEPMGSFEDLHKHMMKQANSDTYGNAHVMSPNECTLSFLNEYFIFKKIRDISVGPLSNKNAYAPINYNVGRAKPLNKTMILN
jgi:hypothetical protein